MASHPPTRDPAAPSDDGSLQLAPVIGALSYAFDLAEGHVPGHSLRACWVGMHVGQEIGLGGGALRDLYYTLLLKDAGCSSNAARTFELYGHDDVATKLAFRWIDLDHARQVVRFVFGHPELRRGFVGRLGLVWDLMRNGDRLQRELSEIRCQRGAEVALELGFSAEVAAGVFSLDEHWDGGGRPVGRAGHAIHVNARIALLAQVVDLFHSAGGREAALAEVRERRGTWLEPRLVDALFGVSAQPTFWSGLAAAGIERRIELLAPGPPGPPLADDRLDEIALTFADVIDKKSVFTIGHSRRVARYADAVCQELGLPSDVRRRVRRSALMHDIGKLGVSNAILDKPGALDELEWAEVRRYPEHTEAILSRIDPFREAAFAAADHRRRLDAREGGPPGAAEEARIETRIITVCDIYDALTSDRPQRPAMSVDEALEVLRVMSAGEVDQVCVQALVGCLGQLHRLRAESAAA